MANKQTLFECNTMISYKFSGRVALYLSIFWANICKVGMGLAQFYSILYFINKSQRWTKLMSNIQLVYHHIFVILLQKDIFWTMNVVWNQNWNPNKCLTFHLPFFRKDKYWINKANIMTYLERSLLTKSSLYNWTDTIFMLF